MYIWTITFLFCHFSLLKLDLPTILLLIIDTLTKHLLKAMMYVSSYQNYSWMATFLLKSLTNRQNWRRVKFFKSQGRSYWRTSSDVILCKINLFFIIEIQFFNNGRMATFIGIMKSLTKYAKLATKAGWPICFVKNWRNFQISPKVHKYFVKFTI
jgi:hypothetical protein